LLSMYSGTVSIWTPGMRGSLIKLRIHTEFVAEVRQRPIPLVGVRENGDKVEPEILRVAQIAVRQNGLKARALRIWGADLGASRFHG
jgi:hypothetical protein